MMGHFLSDVYFSFQMNGVLKLQYLLPLIAANTFP